MIKNSQFYQLKPVIVQFLEIIQIYLFGIKISMDR